MQRQRQDLGVGGQHGHEIIGGRAGRTALRREKLYHDQILGLRHRGKRHPQAASGTDQLSHLRFPGPLNPYNAYRKASRTPPIKVLRVFRHIPRIGSFASRSVAGMIGLENGGQRNRDKGSGFLAYNCIQRPRLPGMTARDHLSAPKTGGRTRTRHLTFQGAPR